MSGTRRVLVVWCPACAEPDASAFEPVVAVVEAFCPRVEVLHPGACAIGVRGPARYFGGEEALARKIIETAAGRGFTCQVGVADGLFAALLAARAARQTASAVVAPGGTPAFLAPFPVSSLGNPELADLLPRLGIRTLGEFAALPATEAANRFGNPGTLAHRLARGLDPRPLAPRPPSVDLSVSVEFDPPAEQSEPAVFAAKALAGQMHAGLAARGLACVRVQVQVLCSGGQEITRLWRHDGLLSALAVAERVRWQLSGWRAAQTQDSASDAADQGTEAGGITLLRLTPDQLVRDEGRQLGLWGDAVISDRVARAAIRVQAMLGHGAVTRPVVAGGRGPAEQVTLVPFGDAADPRYPAAQPWPGRLPAPAPATICPVPVPVSVTDDSGTAVTVTGRAMVSAPPARLSAGGREPGGLEPGGLEPGGLEPGGLEPGGLEPGASAAGGPAPVSAAGGPAPVSAAGGGPWLAITSWAGPWPVDERWWRSGDASRKARFQLVTGDGSAWLATVQNGRWLIEAGYDLGSSAPNANWTVPARPRSLILESYRPYMRKILHDKGSSNFGQAGNRARPDRKRETAGRPREPDSASGFGRLGCPLRGVRNLAAVRGDGAAGLVGRRVWWADGSGGPTGLVGRRVWWADGSGGAGGLDRAGGLDKAGGLDGARELTGLVGWTGSAGWTGLVGWTGSAGWTGLVGWTGLAGWTGRPGPIGGRGTAGHGLG